MKELNNMEDKILAIIRKFKEDDTIQIDSDLIHLGILDSLSIMELLFMLEEEFKIEVDGEDIIPENFETVGKIAEVLVKNGAQN